MPGSLIRQPWETWVVIALGLGALYFAVQSALGLQIFFDPRLETQPEHFIKELSRSAGLSFLVLGAAVLIHKHLSALRWVGAGVFLYLAPWAYKYYHLCAAQPEPHLVWFMVTRYPALTWPTLVLPTGMLLFTTLAVRRLSAGQTVEVDPKGVMPRSS